MRHVGPGLCLLGVILLAVGGCKMPPDLKPPHQPESFALPPENDKSTLLPVCYPSEVLASDETRKGPLTPLAGKKGPTGAVPGGGGMGMGGMGGMSPGGY
jgi:hypothetical protein